MTQKTETDTISPKTLTGLSFCHLVDLSQNAGLKRFRNGFVFLTWKLRLFNSGFGAAMLSSPEQNKDWSMVAVGAVCRVVHDLG